MKKFVVSISAIVICVVACLGLASCDNGLKLPKDNALPNLADCEIGYQFMVYPNVSFYYQIPDSRRSTAKGFLIHIESMTATLVEKRTIDKDATITDETFYPYTIEIKILGSTEESNAGKVIYFILATNFSGRSVSATINQDGSIVATGKARMHYATNFSFSGCELP